MQKVPTSYLKPEPLATSCCAIAIKNNSNENISYFYSNLINDGLNRWYPHSIATNLETWDWIWSNYKTSNCMEIKIPIRNTKFCFIVLVYQGTGSNGINISDEFAKCDVCWTITDKDTNPNWNAEIWNVKQGRIYNLDLINYHGQITVCHDKVEIFMDGYNSVTIPFYRE